MEDPGRTLTVYKASAGSGKTFTLAYEYIKLLLGRRLSDGRYVLNRAGKGAMINPHRRILAITFTNKATAEMKSRILSQLNALSEIDDTPQKGETRYAEMLVKVYGCSREDLRETAREALRGVLTDYGAFNVSTIDAFFQTVLRSFAREIDRQGDYRLELDGRTALAEALGMMFDEINADPENPDNTDIGNWIRENSMGRMHEGADFNLFNRFSPHYGATVGLLRSIFNEDYISREKEMEEYLSDPARIVRFADYITTRQQELTKDQVEAARRLVQVMEGEKGRSSTSLLKLAQNIVEEKGLTTDRYKTLSGSGKKIPQYITDLYEGELGDEPLRLAETLCELYRLNTIYAEIGDKLFNLRAISAIYRYIDRYRAENNLMLISDSNTLLRTIIDGADTPFIYERTGLTLENFLIDEFQDTSRMQWENLRPLVGNTAGTADSLIIGDEKQSIYRWRGGDPALLSSQVASADFPHHSRVKGSAPGENSNYRSSGEIVRFNNTLFRDLAALPSIAATGYEGVAQSIPDARQSRLPARICFENFSNETFDDTARRLLSEESLELLGNDFGPAEASMMLTGRTIMRQLEAGYRQRDIAILCRTNDNAARVAEFIGKHFPAIRFMSEEALLLRSSSAVKMIVSMLQIIDSHENSSDLKISAMADSFENSLTLGTDAEEALDAALRASTATGSHAGDHDDEESTVERIRSLAPSNLSALVQAIIDIRLSPDVCSAEMPYIAAFVDLVDDYIQTYTPTVRAFLEYWNDKSEKLAIAPGLNDDAVTLCTVHKAKGLEWDCVHIPLMNWEIDADPRSQWYDTRFMRLPEGVEAPPIIYLESDKAFATPGSPFFEQYSEMCSRLRTDNLNVAYVAFTRAVRELYVGMLDNTKGGDSATSYLIEVFRKGGDEADTSGLYIDLGRHVLADGSLEIGEPTVPAPEEKDREKEQEVRPVPPFRVSFNELNSRLTSQVDMTNLPPSADIEDDGEETPRSVSDKMEKAAREGTIMHSILSKMQTLDDLDRAVSMHAHLASADELESFRKTILKGFEDAGEMAARWFSPDNARILAEQSIFCKATGKTTRADRIVVYPDGSADLIDYKFTTSIDMVKHYQQVREYALAISRSGFPRLRAYLWYPLLNRIKEIDEFSEKSLNRRNN